MNLYLLNYNTYYNRILKKENTFDEYAKYSNIEPILGIKNFNYADGVATQQTANISDLLVEQYGFPDYAIAVDDKQNIISRYFIIDAVYQCKGQYVVSLYRDLVADYLDYLYDAPIFVEKGPLSEADPFIFNKEDMTFNQIKTEEYLLQDNFFSPWIVGYMTQGNPTKPEDDPNPEEPAPDYSFKFKRKITPDYTVANKSEYASVSGVEEGDARVLQDWGYQVYGNAGGGGQYSIDYEWTMAFNSNGTLPTDYPNGTVYGYSSKIGSTNSALNLGTTRTEKVQEVLNTYISSIGDYFTNFNLISNQVGMEGEDKWAAAINEKNKIVYVSNEGKYYKVSVQSDIVWGTYQSIEGTDIWQKLVEVSDTVRSSTTLQKYANVPYNNNTFGYTMKFKRARVSLVPYEGQPVDEKEVIIPRGRNVLQDAPYCMFAIPYNTNRWFEKEGVVQFGSSSPETVINFVSDMSAAFSNLGLLIDIQLLPYCPIQSRIFGTDGYFDITGLTENADYQFIETDETYHTGIPILWCQQSTFSFNIKHTITNPFEELSFAGQVFKEGKPLPKKLWNETTTYRLCSPNYSSSFEFSPAKNNGVAAFNIDCSYKPFQPYIHINPIFDGLYGKDFDDPRGLICGGDFSLTQLNDAWETYERQNINYEKSFQRQIQNMETNQKYQKLQEQITAITGTIQGGISGAMSGALMSSGNPYATIAGGVAGTAASLAGGIADIAIKDKFRAEAIDFTRDQFGYSLGNIQALPQTISKVSAFTANNKIYPVLETYTATEQEVEALLYKIGYNGMTVMRIGNLNDFILNKTDLGKYAPTGKNYFKGKLINLDVNEDFHIINALSAEINKGVYI